MADPSQARDEGVLYEVVDGSIAVLTLNRPQARNAINLAMVDAISATVSRIETDPAIRVAVLASADHRVFCAGADLKDIAAGRGPDLAPAPHGFAGFVFAPRTKPWIAATEGMTLGGGFELVLACDMIVASESAVFGLPEVQRGLFAGAGGVIRLSRRLPRNVALELITTGARLDVRTAERFGLVNRIAPAGEALKVALDLARTIAANSPTAVRESLRVARLAGEHPEEILRPISDETSALVMGGPDAQEGSRAFAEKRAPVWSSN